MGECTFRRRMKSNFYYVSVTSGSERSWGDSARCSSIQWSLSALSLRKGKKVHTDYKNFRIIGFSLIIGSQILNYFQFDGFIIVLLRCNMSLTWPDVVNTCNVDKVDAIRNCFMYKRFSELQYLQWFQRYVQDYIDISAVMSHVIQAVADSCVFVLRLCGYFDRVREMYWRFVPAARV